MSNKNNFTPKAFLNCLDFQPFNLSTFQKRVVRTKFDIYVLISMNIDIEPYNNILNVCINIKHFRVNIALCILNTMKYIQITICMVNVRWR